MAYIVGTKHDIDNRSASNWNIYHSTTAYFLSHPVCMQLFPLIMSTRSHNGTHKIGNYRYMRWV